MKKKSDKIHKNKTGSQAPANLRRRKKLTLQEQAEERLRFEEQRFRALVENSLDIIVILNPEGIVKYINPAIERVLGYKVEERIGANTLEVIHPGDLEYLADKVGMLFTDTKAPVVQFEVRLRHKDGCWRTFEAVGSNLVQNNAVESVIVNYRDITGRKQAEEKLRREEQRFRALAEQSSDIIVFVNREGIVTYENPAMEKLLGFKPEERIGVNVFDRIHPDDLKYASDAFNTFTLNTSSKDINSPVRQIRLCHKDGSWRTFETSASRLLHDNIVEAVIINVRDITERKRAEEMLKESEKKYRLLAENIHDVVFFMDMNLNYTYISPSVKLLRGYEPEEALKHTPEETLTPSSVDYALKTLSEILEIEKSEQRELNISRTLQLEMSRKDGTTVWVETKASIVKDENQRPIGIMGVTRDITERRQAEDILRKSEQRFRELSIIDDLTQLYNSRHFYLQLEKEMDRSNRYKQPLTILLLDLDKFKDFNDTYGHVEGDSVLSRLGQVVKRCLRETDSAYRYGGEEFTIVLPTTTGKDGIVTAKRIQTELRKEAFSPVSGQEIYMTVSIGLAQYEPKEEMKAFVQRVDQLMYQAKKDGRDRICTG